jgi:UDP:flavonoid glycosyltransferase YjiC (YdhE family)
VPMVVMPANPLIDQKRVGAALHGAGAGMLLRKHAGPQRIRAAIDTVLGDPSYRQAAARLGEDIRRTNGAEVAADAISEFVSSKQYAGS